MGTGDPKSQSRDTTQPGANWGQPWGLHPLLGVREEPQGLCRLSPIKFLAAQRGRGRGGATTGAVSLSLSLSPPGRCRPLPPPARHGRGDTAALGCPRKGKNRD